MSLALIEEIKTEFRINDMGQCTVSIRGAARIVGVNHTTLVRQFKGGALELSKLTEKLAGIGLKGGAFLDSGIPDIALSAIIEYYA